MNNTTRFHNENNCTSVQESIQTTSNVLYTVKEVAQLLKTNIDYVHKLRKSRLLPFLKIGQYKVRKQSLELFLEQYEGNDLTDPFNVKELN
jgi:excisionase family DNA binding protein